MGRRKKATDRAAELKDQAKAVAGEGGEALKDFAAQTGSAAKEFATKASAAAHELVESIEKAAKGATEQEEPHRGRRLLKLFIAVGAGIALATNESARKAIKSLIKRGDTTRIDQPEIWRPESVNGGNAQKAATASDTTTL
jgi:hypothetical protein